MNCRHKQKLIATSNDINVYQCGARQFCTEQDHGLSLHDGSPMPVCANCPLLPKPINPNKKLTIGIPYFRDWPGLWATIQSIRLCHREVENDVEIIVVDNDATGEPDRVDENNHSWKAKRLCQSIGAKYEHFTTVAGTAAAKGRIFDLATAPAVLVMDCHVILPSLTIANLILFFEDNFTKDLYQGPCIGDGGFDDIVGTHFAKHWGSLMYGTWATDPRAHYEAIPTPNRDRDRRGSPDPAAPPDRRSPILSLPAETRSPIPAVDERFEIDMQGCGLFACRRDAWPGFHQLLRGFGPEEFHLHQRFRRQGGRCWCLPWLRWCHRFGNPDGTRPPGLHPEERLRGHLITFLDTGTMPGSPTLPEIRHHFVEEAKALTNEQFFEVLKTTVAEFWPDRPDTGATCPHRGPLLGVVQCEIGCVSQRGSIPLFNCQKHQVCSPWKWQHNPTTAICLGCKDL